MKLRNYLSVIWMYLAFEATLARRCDKRPSQIAPGRRCRKTCVDNTECKAAQKTCNCDGECGMSCYNPEAVCSEPETIPHGSVSRSGLKMQSVATYSCIAGYVLKGTRKRTCRADKKWYPKIPRCKKGCIRPSRIAYAYLPSFRESFPVNKTVQYKCRAGYYTNADRAIKCMKSGKWTVANLICRQKTCRPLIPSDSNGHIVYSSREYYGSIATLQCDPGFYLEHIGRRQICTSGRTNSQIGSWSGPSLGHCLRKQCPPPLIPRNGRFVYESLSTRNEYDTKIRYSCDVGFRLEGNVSTTCDYTGSWDDPPICIDIKCPQPPTSRLHATRSWILYENGNLLLPNSNVHYQCNKNFKVSGLLRVFHFATSVCEYQEATGNSAWNPALDTIACEEIFCNRPHVGMHHNLHNNKESWRVGETVTASCKKGYGFSLERFVDTVTCTDSGEWHSSFTPCQDIRCPEPKLTITNGKRDSKSDTDVTYRCDENYQIYASNRVTTKTVKCIRYYGFRRSEWALNLNGIGCERITCRNPPQNWHMEAYKIVWHSEFNHRKGRWEAAQDLQRSERGYAGLQTIFRCAKGYEFDYTTSKDLGAQCLATGRWENSLKPCVEDIKCPEPPVRITNGNRQTLFSGPVYPESVATYRCHSGYGISHGNTYTGEANIACTKNIERLGSTWKPLPIQIDCRDMKCIHPPELQKNAKQISVTYASGGLLLPESVVHYQCIGPNYKFSGSHLIFRVKIATCRYRSTSGDSAWDPPLDGISCEEIRCSHPPQGDNQGIVQNKFYWRIGERVKAYCKEGYGFSSENFTNILTCTNLGNWNSQFTSCQDIRCPRPRDPIPNGFIYEENRERVVYQCEPGFQFPGGNASKTVKCRRFYNFKNSIWEVNRETLSCEPITCPVPEVAPPQRIAGNKTEWTKGENVFVFCDPGYEHEPSNTTLTCLWNRQWEWANAEFKCYKTENRVDRKLTLVDKTEDDSQGEGSGLSLTREESSLELDANAFESVENDGQTTSPRERINDQQHNSGNKQSLKECTTPIIDPINQRISEAERSNWSIGDVVTVECLENFQYKNSFNTKNYTCRGRKNPSWKPRNISSCRPV